MIILLIFGNKYLRNTAGEANLHFNTGYLSDRFRSVFYISNTYTKAAFLLMHMAEPRRVMPLCNYRSRQTF